MTDPAHLRAEARDPATPLQRLIELMGKHLDDVLQNPAWPLLVVEQPGLWRMLRPGLLLALAQSPRCPVEFADWVIRNEDRPNLHRALMDNPAVPAATQRQLFLERLPDLTLWHFYRPRLPALLGAEVLALLEHAGAGERRPAPVALTAAEFDQLAKLGRVGLQLALRHRACPRALRERAWHGSPQTRNWVLAHPDADPAWLTEALQGPDPRLRRTAAQNPSLSRAQLEAAAADPEANHMVASNPSLPPEWVERFLAHRDANVRSGLSYNPALPESAQLQLIRDPEPMVRMGLRDNPALTDDARVELDAADAATEANL